MMREIALWWRTMQIAAQCPLVTRVLKCQRCFEPTVARYFDGHRTSPFVEELTEGFLSFLCSNVDSFVRSVARLELALARARAGSEQTTDILFDRNPERAFLELERSGELIPPEAAALYRVKVERGVPGLASCTREEVE